MQITVIIFGMVITATCLVATIYFANTRRHDVQAALFGIATLIICIITMTVVTQ